MWCYKHTRTQKLFFEVMYCCEVLEVVLVGINEDSRVDMNPQNACSK